jgi:CRP/FNR family cyclic AMP-dependent transcriptional regulator
MALRAAVGASCACAGPSARKLPPSAKAVPIAGTDVRISRRVVILEAPVEQRRIFPLVALPGTSGGASPRRRFDALTIVRPHAGIDRKRSIPQIIRADADRGEAMQRAEGLAILKTHGWLAGTPAAFRDRFLSAARWRQVAAGSTVTLGGENESTVIGLAHGTVTVTSTLGRVGTPMTHMALPVFWMGYGSLLLERQRVVTVEARTDIWIAAVPGSAVLPMLDETTQWWRCFMRLLGEYGDISATIASDLLIRRPDQRLAATILRFAGLRGNGARPLGEPRLRVTQAELADAANLSRNVAGRILRHLAAQGYIEADYRSILVRDPDGLRALVERSDG